MIIVRDTIINEDESYSQVEKDPKNKRTVFFMVWFFVLVTVITYLSVMKYVLKNIQQPVKAADSHANHLEKGRKKLVPAHTTR
ncbi:hypothetical protein J2S21_004619 [Peribacillus cavernae]|nr:hypothetical protein [Peribacillus cavernae]